MSLSTKKITRYRWAVVSTFLFLLVSISFRAHAQQTPFWNDIQQFKKQDSAQFPPKHAILFVGSSSFTNWKDVQSYFPGYTIINRGFGGASLTDVILYADDIIFPYHPREIVIYCGENDLAASDTVSAQTVFGRFKILYEKIRERFPQTPIVFISLKPSPSRKHLMPKMGTANDRIAAFLRSNVKTAFVDVYHKMLNPDGSPIKEIFGPDELHMNAKGYAIWQKAIQPWLLKDEK